MKNKVVVLSVHPDDETLGCGGTLLRHRACGDRIYWIIATDMKEGFSSDTIRRREKEIARVSELYGFHGVVRLGFPATMVDKISEKKLVEAISIAFSDIGPQVAYLPFENDPHGDHRALFNAACSSAKTFRCPSINKLLMMETLSETEFAPPLFEKSFCPNYFVDISDFICKKLAIAKVYSSEIGRHPFPRNLRNIKALALYRGASAGCRYAESFMCLKEIWRK
jgi:LmbE family N-acetylglucosaminyl deacetylase